MKLIPTTFLAVATLFTVTSTSAQNKKITESVQINGNCGMCKKTIETAANTKAAKLAWNADTKTATITYNPKKTSIDEVLKRVAIAGYDNEKYAAQDDVYTNLHGCCQYERAEKLAPTVTQE